MELSGGKFYGGYFKREELSTEIFLWGKSFIEEDPDLLALFKKRLEIKYKNPSFCNAK